MHLKTETLRNTCSHIAKAGLLLLAVLTTQFLKAQALDAPTITCVSVNAVGGAVITWEAPADPNAEFTSYNLYYSENSLAYSLVASINNYNTTNFVHNAANAGTGSVCYYMETVSNDGSPQTSAPSDPLCSIFLEVNQSNPEGFAVLDWDLLVEPTDPLWFYEVYVEYPVGTWTLAATVPIGLTAYNYEVSTCGEFLNFKVNLNTGYGCVYESNIEGDFFQDTTAPEIPVVTSIDVDSTTNQAVINWEASMAGDTDGYIIYECVNGFTLIVDTVWGQFNTSFTNPTSTAGVTGAEGYNVASFDTCLVGNPPSPNTSPTSSDCQFSMFLTASWFPCTDVVNLNWNPYQGWSNGVAFYEVYAKTNGNAPQLLSVVDGTESEYAHVGVVAGNTYEYFIKAFASINPYEAISNKFVLNISQFQQPAQVYLSTATVADEDLVDIRVFLDPVPDTFYFNLQRLDEDDEEWETLFTQVAQNINFLEFTDPTAKTDERSYSYRIKVDNSCGDSVMVSNIGKTIFLSGLANSANFVNTISWSPYIDWDGDVNEYVIYRTIEGVETFNPIATVNPGNLYYEDDVFDLLLTPGEFCYTIEGRENSNFLGISESSFSNEFCVTQDPKIWIPNAFIVNGVNNVFKPVISFADFENYQMIIYNRWGDQIFETTDIEEGWDGKVNGKLVQEGQYMYYISVADGFGGFNERKGAVIMLVSKD